MIPAFAREMAREKETGLDAKPEKIALRELPRGSMAALERAENLGIIEKALFAP